KCTEILGYQPEELIGKSLSDRSLCPDELICEENESGKMILEGTASSVIIQVNHRDGRRRLLKINSAPLFDNDCIIGGMVLADDITDTLAAADALRESERNLRRITDNMSDLVSELDRAGNVIFASPSHLKVLGYSEERMMNIKLKEFVHPDDLAQVISLLKHSLQTGERGVSQHRCQHQDGYYVWTETVGNPIWQNGKITGIVISSRDITDRKMLEQELRHLSVHDTLTSLYNRTYFEEEINRLENDRNNPVGMIIFDLDNLKLVNDTMGHEAGDRLLQNFARILGQCFRSGDVISRVGGDEFAVIMPKTSEEVLNMAAERVNHLVNEYDEDNPTLPLSVSMGIAYRQDGRSSLRDIYKEADNRMYRAKLQHSGSVRDEVISTLLKALQTRDYMTEGHGERMKELVMLLGGELKLPDNILIDLQLLAQFHDIGKVGIPDWILFKKERLTADEYREMKRHSEIGQRIALATPDLSPLADLILLHHEWWDGSGYPLGLAGEQIPLECRIIALADAYDTMTHDRPFSKAISPQEAMKEIARCSGSQFDPKLAALLLKLLGYYS
ncbi:MAG TPA: diguanylate cyclase, partial [Syntrophomonas sp.]|nr:diguanylate cyclase [Syntrophomonas sp.]